jgi:hypothetical protein
VEETPKQASKDSFVDIYRVKSYDPNTHVVIVQHSNQLITATVTSAHSCAVTDCFSKPDSSWNDSRSVAGDLVGRNIVSEKSGTDLFFENRGKELPDIFYQIVNIGGVVLLLGEQTKVSSENGTHYWPRHTESWEIRKVEEVNP